MNCSDWEREIAAESGDPELAGHLAECERCREFLAEVEANRVALRALTVHPAALEAVRRRVLGEIRQRRARFVWWPWAAVVAACAAVFCFLFWPKGEVVRPRVVHTAVVPAPEATIVREPVRRKHRVHMSVNAARRSACATCAPLKVKMLTDDPDVIVIWLVDSKGDSL